MLPQATQPWEAKGDDYWGLGHIHKRQIIAEYPHIAYPGNTQGRHVARNGAKRRLLVSVEDGQLARVEFRPTDVVRWHWATVSLATTMVGRNFTPPYEAD